jgi:transposase
MKMGGDRRSQRIEAHAEFILAQIKAKPDMTIMELREKIRERHGLGFGYGTMWRFLARHKITRKKKTGHASEQEREDVESAREDWFEGQLDLDPLKLVFIDETRVSTNLARRFDRFDRIDAPMTIDGALDGEAFRAYVEQVLAPTLSAGEIVVMDNVPVHKVAGVREVIAAKGAGVLYLPGYSPDFNPIEKSFSKIKSILERIAASTADALQAAVREAPRSFTPDECRSYFAACGYDAL